MKERKLTQCSDVFFSLCLLLVCDGMELNNDMIPLIAGTRE